MESAINKKNAIAAMADKEGTPEIRTRAGILVALIEIREAIEEGLAHLTMASDNTTSMIIGCKDSLDGFLQERLEADKTLAGLYASIWADHTKNDEKPNGPVDEPKKSRVTLSQGDFGGPKQGSGVY